MKLFITFCCLIGVTIGAKLGTYNVDRTKISASGVSSGAAIATQLHVAYSNTISGVGLVAGPPYLCSGGSSALATTTCMSGLLGIISLPLLYNAVNSYFGKGLIDDTKNIKDDKIYVFHGLMDTLVGSYVAKKDEEFYKNYVTDSANQIKTVYSLAAAHGFITNNYGGLCSVINLKSYLNNCGYNQAYEILKHMYGSTTQEPPKTMKQAENLIEFDQTEFFPGNSASSISMDSLGYVYVPTRCRNGNQCKLHVALHGCAMGRHLIGDEFAINAGFNQVSDLNDVIILYPQAKASLLTNPTGCWDWWGYTDDNFATKKGQQMQAIKGMIDRLTGASF